MSFSRVTVAVLGLFATKALAGDFIDTRVTFALANSNVFAKPGETSPSEPGTGFGAGRQNTQFYDNFNTRASGFETLSNISLYKKSPSFFDGFEAEAGFNILVNDLASGAIQLFDNSSFVKLNYRPAGWGPKEDISFTGFPVSSDRFRLGYAWKLSWGGDSAFTYNQGPGAFLTSSGLRPAAAPGAKFTVTRDRWYAFVGSKTGLLLSNLSNVQERQYGALGGFGIAILPNRLRFEMNGGYFQRGLAPSLAQQGIRAPVNLLGGSSQLSFYSDEILPSIDLRLYKNDPEVANRFFLPEKYPGGLTYQLSVEGSLLGQTLVDPDTFGKTKVQKAWAVAVQARFKYDFWRLYVLGQARSLSFIQLDVPGFPPYTDFASGSVVRPELWSAVGGDRFFEKLHLTVGVVAGIQSPASLTAPKLELGGVNPPQGLTGRRTVVLRDVNLPSILPEGESVLPIVSVKTTFKLDLSDYFAALGEVFYNWDANRTTFLDSTASVATPAFEKPHQLGFNLILQARY